MTGVLFVFVPFSAFATDYSNDVSINEKTFPDKQFRKRIEFYDKDNSGSLSEQEIQAVEEIWIDNYSSNSKVSSLKGIEYFTNLKKLDCKYNSIVELDLSSNLKLESLECSNNSIAKLDLSCNTHLKKIVCQKNNITNLTLPDGNDLVTLDCDQNEIKDLDLTKCENLSVLDCKSDSIAELDLSSNPKLERLECSNNSIAQLDLSNNDHLVSVSCNHNSIERLDLSNLKQLEYLDCSNNDVLSLELGTNVLSHLDCSHNAIKVIELNDSPLKDLDCSFNTLETIELNYCPQYLDIKNNKLSELVLPQEGNSIDELDCQNNNIERLIINGSLERLFILAASNNRIKELKLIGAKRLHYLYLNKNCFEEIDLSDCNNLKWLALNNNNLSFIDLTNCTELEDLSLYKNKLTSLDLSHQGKIVDLDCSTNMINSLTLSGCPTKLYCNENDLESLSLPKEGSRIKDLCCQNNKLKSIAIEGSLSDLKSLLAFNNELSEINLKGANHLETLWIEINKLKSIDLSDCAQLESLRVGKNNLTDLDLFYNTKLCDLSIEENQIRSIDLYRHHWLNDLNIDADEGVLINREKNLEDCSMTCIPESSFYDGSVKETKIEIRDGNRLLEEGYDYTLERPSLLDSGEHIISAHGRDNFTGTIQCSYNIYKAEPVLKFEKSSLTKTEDDIEFINDLTTKTDGIITYSSSNENVAKVDNLGQVTIKGIGSAVITANAAPGKNYKSGKASYSLTVSKAVHEATLEDLSYSFANSRKAFDYSSDYHIPLNIFYKIYGKTVKAKFLYDIKSFKANGWGGNCAGFSGTSALLFDKENGIYPSTFKMNAEKISDLSIKDTTEDNFTVVDFIESMQIAQYEDLFKEARLNNKKTSSQLMNKSKTLNDFHDSIKAQTEVGVPVLIAICQSGMGHAVLAYHVEDKGRISEISIYENQHPLEERTITLEKNSYGDWGEWSYDLGGSYGYWGSDNETSSISYVPYAVLKTIWENRGELHPENNLLYTNTKNFVVTNNEDEILVRVENGEVVDSSSKIIMDDEDLSLCEESDMVGLSLPANEYQIVNYDKSINAIEVSTVNEELGSTIKTSASEVHFCVDDSQGINSVKIPSSTNKTFSVSLNSTRNIDKEEVFVEGVGSGQNTEISQMDGNVTVHNCQVTSMNVSGESVKTYSIKANVHGNGTISPIGTKEVVEGSDLVYTIAAQKNHIIKDVKVDGVSVGAVSKYVFKNVRGPHMIYAEFSPRKAFDPSFKESISKAEVIGLKSKTYNGKPQRIKLTLTLGGKKLSEGADYTLICRNNKNVGFANVTIKGKGRYKGSINKTFKIIPRRTSLNRIKCSRKEITVSWKKRSVQTSGYQIQYGENKMFMSGVKQVVIKNNRKVKKKIKGLKRKKKYYVRIRTIKRVNGKMFYSKWSKVKTVRLR